MQITGVCCRPLLATAVSQLYGPGCAALMQKAFGFLKQTKVDTLLLAGSWRSDELAALAETLDWLNHNAIPTILFGPKVQYDAPLPRIMAQAIERHEPQLPDRHRPSNFANLDRDMEALARAKGVAYVSFFRLLCRDESCDYAVDGHPLTFDIGHFTRWGSSLVATRLRTSDMGGLAERLSTANE